MSELLDKLKALDDPIAKKYVALTKDDPKVQIDSKGANEILQVARKNKKITDKELDAIILLIQTDVFTTDAKKVVEQGMITELTKVTLKDPQAKGRLLNADEVNQVFSALSMAATNVSFVSNGTYISFDADKYEAIKVLIKQNDIMLVAANYPNRPAGLKGRYYAASNIMFIFEGGSGGAIIDAPNIVHELTHAIQDFSDIYYYTKNVETDAYIAETVCERVMKKPIEENEKIFGRAVDIVMQKNARLSNDNWMKVYRKAADDLDDLMSYKGSAEDMKGSDVAPELDKLKTILSDIQAKKKGGP
jgi:hypothetical protein